MLFIGLLVVIVLFGAVVFVGAPYLPTLKSQSHTALDMLNLKPGQTLLELGCGDGRVLRLAAERGLKAVGYELNPILFLYSWLTTRLYRKQITVRFGNYWTATWPKAEGIFVFLLPKYMSKLDTKITQEYKQPVKLVSFAFKIPGKKIDQEKAGLLLYNFGN